MKIISMDHSSASIENLEVYSKSIVIENIKLLFKNYASLKKREIESKDIHESK